MDRLQKRLALNGYLTLLLLVWETNEKEKMT